MKGRMAKNSKPLHYLVHPSLMNTPEIIEVIRKGHIVTSMAVATIEDILNADLIIGPSCYRLSTETIHLLELATKAERASKYEGKHESHSR
jgi:hypothetical protein